MTDAEEMNVRAAVADDNRNMLQAIVATLSSEFEVVATATEGRSALAQIRSLQPAVAVHESDLRTAVRCAVRGHSFISCNGTVGREKADRKIVPTIQPV